MKRIPVVFLLVVCLLVTGQTASLAETVSVTSMDDPGFSGGTLTDWPDTNWQADANFSSGELWQPLPLVAEESAEAGAKGTALEQWIATDTRLNPLWHQLLDTGDSSVNDAEVASTIASLTSGTITKVPSPSILPRLLPWYEASHFKIPNYNQGSSPYCGPFSALQILRYKKYSESSLLQNLIREMYIPGQGSSIYRLALSLRKRLRYAYYPGTVTSSSDYAGKHRRTVGKDRMPIDNLVRIYAGQLGKYRRYHSGHYIDSSGYYFSMYKALQLLYTTDTYQEYLNGQASGTLGPQWVSFYQMYRGVRYHPLKKVVW